MRQPVETATDLAPVLPSDIRALAGRTMRRLAEAELRLATAESCTGGLLSALLTDVEGASHAFERGYVTYSDRAKCELLAVEPGLIAAHGAVSREVAVAMAEGAAARSDADIALAITGFAGPGNDGEEPGLVHIACARAGRTPRHREEHFGDIGRGPTRIGSLRVALAMIGEAVER